MAVDLSLPMVTRRPAQLAVPPAPGRAAVDLWPLTRGDVQPILDVFDGMSARSRWLRFLAPLSQLSGPMLAALADVDQCRQVAWAASAAGRTIGIGRYFRLRAEPGTAEIALAIVDDYHRQGVGRLLLDALTVLGLHRAVAAFAFTVHPQNRPTLGLLRTAGARGRYRDGLYEATLRLTRPAGLRFDPDALLRLADSAAQDARAVTAA